LLQKLLLLIEVVLNKSKKPYIIPKEKGSATPSIFLFLIDISQFNPMQKTEAKYLEGRLPE